MKVWPEGDANGTRIEQQTAQKAFLGNINHELIDFQPTAATTENPTSTSQNLELIEGEPLTDLN